LWESNLDGKGGIEMDEKIREFHVTLDIYVDVDLDDWEANSKVYDSIEDYAIDKATANPDWSDCDCEEVG
jgi:hypothetical protein